MKVCGTSEKSESLQELKSPGYPQRPLGFRLLNQFVRHAPLKKKFSHNSILMRKKLHDVGKPTELPKDCEFVRAKSGDIDAIMRHPEALSSEVYRNRLAAGDICYCLKRQGEIIGYNWVKRHTCGIHCGFEQGIDFLPLERDQAFSYDFYIYRNHRRLGLGKVVKKQLLWALQSEGVNDICSLVMPYNLISLKVHLSLGFRAECMVYGYRLGGWTWTYFDRGSRREKLNEWVARAKAYFTLEQGSHNG